MKKIIIFATLLVSYTSCVVKRAQERKPGVFFLCKENIVYKDTVYSLFFSSSYGNTIFLVSNEEVKKNIINAYFDNDTCNFIKYTPVEAKLKDKVSREINRYMRWVIRVDSVVLKKKNSIALLKK